MDLYGSRDPYSTKSKHKPISSSTTSAFTSNLSALISSTKSAQALSKSPQSGSLKRKSDIFTSSNRNVKSRAAADLQAEQAHKTKHDLDSVSQSELHRSRRKMEEKARLYNAMKRGEYIGRGGHDDRGLVDFDRKFAEQARDAELFQETDSDDNEVLEADNDIVEFLDEFGRLRKGTKKEKEKFERQQRIQNSASLALVADSARPTAPSNIIYGDTIQRGAFNPDTVISDRMAELVAKRDKSATPPPEVHYDANAEIRNRGTGFFAFSKDAELRKEEMESLEQERLKTEGARREREQAKERRKREIEERRKAIQEKKKERRDREADKFLESLDIQLPCSDG